MTRPLVVEVAVAPEAPSVRPSLLDALARLTQGSVSLAFAHDPESGQTILKGDSEQALDGAIRTLTRDMSLAIGAPQVAYRETLLRSVEKDFTFKKQSAGVGQFARVVMSFAPCELGGFESQVVGDAVPDALVCGVAAGVASAMRSGVLAGFPVVGVRATLRDGACHVRDSSALTFEVAARLAAFAALRDGGSVLLEPVMAVEIRLPEACLDVVTADLRVRRGTVRRETRSAGTAMVDALVPFANLLGYANQLRSSTEGRGRLSLVFSHYARIPSPRDEGPAAPAIALRA